MTPTGSIIVFEFHACSIPSQARENCPLLLCASTERLHTRPKPGTPEQYGAALGRGADFAALQLALFLWRALMGTQWSDNTKTLGNGSTLEAFSSWKTLAW